MSFYSEIKGNLLDCGADVIVQQINCSTVDSAGLAFAISAKFPYADVYSSRPKDPESSYNITYPFLEMGTLIMAAPPKELVQAKELEYLKAEYCFDFIRDNSDLYTSRGSDDLLYYKSLKDLNTKEKEKYMPIVACLAAQICPYESGSFNARYGLSPTVDTKEDRLKAFNICLGKLVYEVFLHKYKKIAFPKMIGCGLAGGSWKDYEQSINIFSESVKEFGTEVIVVDLAK